MSWLRRRRDEAQERPEQETENPRVITTEEDVQRAEQAARVAALHLQTARDRREIVDEKADRLATFNRENGFSELIRNAFGS